MPYKSALNAELERLWQILSVTGFDTFVYRLDHAYHLFDDDPPVLFFRGINPAWQTAYGGNMYAKGDNVRKLVKERGGVTSFQEFIESNLDDDDADFVNIFVKLHGENVISFPLFGPNGYDAFVVLSHKNRESGSILTGSDLHWMKLNEIHVKIVEIYLNGRRAAVGLSAREIEVLNYLAAGVTKSKISKSMTIGIDTVDSYTRRIYAKLSVNNRIDAVIKSLKYGLIKL